VDIGFGSLTRACGRVVDDISLFLELWDSSRLGAGMERFVGCNAKNDDDIIRCQRCWIVSGRRRKVFLSSFELGSQRLLYLQTSQTRVLITELVAEVPDHKQALIHQDISNAQLHRPYLRKIEEDKNMMFNCFLSRKSFL
jgi:hypothetical protein